MDIKQLKPEIEKYLAVMQKDGKEFSFVALDSAYPGISDASYVLKVKAGWISNKSCKEVIDYMVDKMYETLDISVRIFINSIEILDINDMIHCGTNCLVIEDRDRNSIMYSV